MLDAGDGLNSSQFSRHEGDANSTASECAVTGLMVGEVSTISEGAGGFKSTGPVICTALDSPAPFEVSNCRII